MAISNHERVGQALQLLNQGVAPFVEREMTAAHGDKWLNVAAEGLRDHQSPVRRDGRVHWDTQSLLLVMWNEWNRVFRKTLGHAERSLVSELREVRNAWAHQQRLSTNDAYRALDSIQRLLTAVSAAAESQEVEKQKQDLLRVRFAEEARRESRKAAVAAIEGEPLGGLKPWREVITPHPDVASGNYLQAEFAADLWQVYLGEGVAEYRDPVEFFRRTFLTEGLKQLLINAVRRLGSGRGDPVIELQTNFGGGKTHSMLALYHVVCGRPASELAGMEPVLEAAGEDRLPAEVRTVVLVGNKISPGRPDRKPDGTMVRTLWGELAYQLGGAEAYGLVREDDERATNPGDRLRELLNRYSPCSILIDEWVAYARQLHEAPDLPGGTFDTQFTFAQTLSEAAKSADRALLVVSIPSSDIELGGERGREALDRLKNAIGRVESPWRPASVEESFEIVRRRLFQSIEDPALYAARDAVVRAFTELYRQQSAEFPSACREPAYERRLRDAYPIHPEFFDRLFNDWSSLDKFQRTRGVLRLMASVIHHLWEREDRSLLILPASAPMDAGPVQSELTRYLEDNWVPVLEKDVDGPNSLPLRLDREQPNLGRYSASRRVARTVYIGSAPTLQSANKGIDDRHVKLGCAQPGEAVPTFGDALRRLTAEATYLYEEHGRYWYSTQPNVTQLARERAAQLPQDDVFEEIRRRVREELRSRAEFARVHPFPASSSDVPDERETALVVFGPDKAHSARHADSAALSLAKEVLETRGGGPRLYRNTLVFLAADKTRLGELEQAVRQYLAWKSIEADREVLNLDAQQYRQTQSHKSAVDAAATARVPETFAWLLVPEQSDPKVAPTWQEIRLQGEGLTSRAARKLKTEELLVTGMGGVRLRMELDRIPLWRGPHVPLKQLAEDFAKYLYLPRLRSETVLTEAVQDGFASPTWNPDTFAYADAYDEATKAYRGLQAGQARSVGVTPYNVLVKPDVAADLLKKAEPPVPVPGPGGGEGGGGKGGTGGGTKAEEEKKLRRFHGTVEVDPARLGRNAPEIAKEVVAHLAGLVGADVRVRIEIDADIQDGVPENVMRTVTENCRVLKFKVYGFEEE